MGPSLSLLERVATAQETAKTSEARIAEILHHMEGQDASSALTQELRAATVSLETLAADTFSVFESRMQHHFKRGPFSRKLKARLLEAQKTDLAERVHHYYLAVNVLKHGKGASYRELLKTPEAPFVVKPSEDTITDEADKAAGLVDVTVPGFFDGLSATLREAYHFLEGEKSS
ncbi:hypothetical protein [Pseudophaeobacter leonis]|uniref:hypothetical protein n=1 Tax=Pseudophaeobacter leonis TaxID=1144477 RepID=UPI0009F1F84E|nr:hypothetical protein [Pseudophaeobacter leonis]